VSKNRSNHHWTRLPADWGYPKFPLAQLVQAKTVLPDATRIQTGRISAIQYIKPDSFWVTQHGLKPGWHYYIEVDAEDPWYFSSPVLCIEESEISELNELTRNPCSPVGVLLLREG
jgi:hypothetical protein